MADTTPEPTDDEVIVLAVLLGSGQATEEDIQRAHEIANEVTPREQ
jgi:hypothetical protein